jgi:type IV pilus assembly protein PilE
VLGSNDNGNALLMNANQVLASRQASARPKGFTLIELMITVAVVAILTAIAFPSYTAYIQRGRISEAVSSLATTRVRLEQFYQDNRNYGSTASLCGVTMPTTEHFTVTCNWGAGGTAQSYLLTATGNAASNMSAYAYTVDQSNVQSTTAFPGAASLPVNCWLQRKGQSC